MQVSRQSSPKGDTLVDDKNTEASWKDSQEKLSTHVLPKENNVAGEDGGKIAESDEYPDGGLGWIMALNGALLVFSTFGFANSWGVFQEYYRTNILQDSSPSAVSWIGSIQYCLLFLPGAFTGRLLDRGYLRGPLFIASVIYLAAVFITAECKRYWQLMLVQGVILGLSGGFVFGPSIPLMQHWFKRRRATAYGIVATGASVGGTIFPIVTRSLIPKLGFQWTIRVLGFILLLTIGLPNLFLRPRLPPKNIQFGFFSTVAFKSLSYSLLVSGVFVAFLGMYTVLTYIDVAGVSFGLDPNFSFYLVAIANAGSALGRLGGGMLGDYLGPTNTLIPFTLLGAATTFAWPYCTSKGGSIALAIIYGAASGAFMGLMSIPVARFGGAEDLGRRTGMLFSIGSIGALLGPPISGAIHDTYGGFDEMSIYAGSMIAFAAFLIICARQTNVGRLWANV